MVYEPLRSPDTARLDGEFVETLEQAWAIAESVDQYLAAAVSDVCAASNSRAAADAERMPLATLAGRYTLRDNEPSFRIESPALPFEFSNPYLQDEDLSFEARLYVPLYTGGSTTCRIAAADAEVTARCEQRDTLRQQLKIQVAREYFAVLRADQNVDVAASHERSLEAHARDTRARYQCQQVARNDLLAAEVAWNDSRHQVIQARNQADIARAAYNRRLGRPLSAEVTLAIPQVAPRSLNVDELSDIAVGSRPELAQLDAQIRSLQCQAAAVLGENRAQVGLEAGYRFQENQYQTPEGITSAAVGVSWNLFDGGRVRSRAGTFQQQAVALQHRRADLQSQVRLQVRRAWLDVQESRDRVKITRDSIDRAEENFRVTRQRYQRGLCTNTDVLAAETLRVVSHQNHNNALLDSVLTVLELHRTIGAL